MPIKKYKMSEKRKLRDLDQTDVEKRVRVWMLRQRKNDRNKPLTFRQIGKIMKMSHQAAHAMYKKVENMDIKEIDTRYKLAIDSAINKDDTRS